MIHSSLKRFFRHFDWLGFGLTIALLTFGLSMVFSATFTPMTPISSFLKRQAFGACSGLALYLVVAAIDPRLVIALGFIGYHGALALLCYTLLTASPTLGAQRWMSIYFFKFQPSELAKLFFPFFLGHLLQSSSSSARTTDAPTNRFFIIPTIMLLIGFGLIFKQPDLGTGLILLFIGTILFWVAGLPTRFFVFLALAGMASTPILWTFLKPYQQQRIMSLLGQGDNNKERYQLEQSKIAVGSGRLRGKGFLQGTQNKLSFLPEDHNDFIFAVICEELGLLGVLILFSLFCALGLHLFGIAMSLEMLSQQIIIIGIAANILISAIVNTGMVSGLLPIVGIPLPFFSYGITNLWSTLIGLGIINGIAARRHFF